MPAPMRWRVGLLIFALGGGVAEARPMTLWVAGNSTNHDGSSGGDRAAGTMMTLTVADAPPPPDFAGAPPDFAGAPPGADLSSVTNPPPPASDLAVTPTPSGRDLA